MFRPLKSVVNPDKQPHDAAQFLYARNQIYQPGTGSELAGRHEIMNNLNAQIGLPVRYLTGLRGCISIFVLLNMAGCGLLIFLSRVISRVEAPILDAIGLFMFSVCMGQLVYMLVLSLISGRRYRKLTSQGVMAQGQVTELKPTAIMDRRFPIGVGTKIEYVFGLPNANRFNGIYYTQILNPPQPGAKVNVLYVNEKLFSLI